MSLMSEIIILIVGQQIEYRNEIYFKLKLILK